MLSVEALLFTIRIAIAALIVRVSQLTPRFATPTPPFVSPHPVREVELVVRVEGDGTAASVAAALENAIAASRCAADKEFRS